MSTVVLRLTNTYGPRQLLKHNRQGFIGVFVKQILQGEKLLIYGDGKQVRDMNYVDDVVDALLVAGIKEESYGQAYNLGGSEPISLHNLAKLLVELNGSGEFELMPFPAEKKRIDIGDYYGDYRKFSQMTGWQPKTSVRDGFAKMLAYYKENLSYYLDA
jgi:nucleoside-diphosphate-sugar epimerase